MLKNWLIVARRAARAFDVRRHNIPVVLWQLPFPPDSSSAHPPSLPACAVLFASERNHSCRNICKHLFLTPPHTAASVCVQCVCHVCVYKCVCICVCACWKLSRLALKSFFANIATARSLQAICHWNSWTCCCFYYAVVVVVAMLLLLLQCCCCCRNSVSKMRSFINMSVVV